jgi:hypothetical protein
MREFTPIDRPKAQRGIQVWHWGRIVLVWVAAIVLTSGSGFLLAYGPHGPAIANIVIRLILLLVFLASPVVAFGITWKWLGGKNQDQISPR